MNSAELAEVAALALAAAESRVLFGVPGGGINLDLVGAAEANGIRFVLTHSESTAAYMAATYAELTGVPTGCVVTRGPGAANAVNGIAHAWLDRQPVLLFTDAVSSTDAPRIAHQRLNQPALFKSVTNWSTILGGGDPAGTMRCAIDRAAGPRPGPVHLDVDPSSVTAPPDPVGPARPAGDLDAVAAILSGAQRVAVVLGVGARRHANLMRSLVRGTNIPVLQTYKAKGLIPDSWPNAAGLFTGATMEAPILQAADAILMVGVDSVELIPADWAYLAPVVALAGWEEDTSYFTPAAAAIGALEDLVAGLPTPLPDGWQPESGRTHRQRIEMDLSTNQPVPHGLAPADVVNVTRAAAPGGCVATVDAGAHMLVAMPLWHTEEPGEVLISSGLATMGFALPAAIAAAIARPQRRVYCFVGDGGLGMVLAELETAVRLQLPVTVIVFNDSTLSMIRIKQRDNGHGGSGAVTYNRADFARIAEGMGMPGLKVNTSAQLTAALTTTDIAAGPMLLDINVDPQSYPYIMQVSRGM